MAGVANTNKHRLFLYICSKKKIKFTESFVVQKKVSRDWWVSSISENTVGQCRILRLLEGIWHLKC